MKYLLIIFALLACPSFADEIPEGTVELNTKVYPKKAFRKNKRIKVQEMEKMVPHPDAIPTKVEREAVFARIPGLAEHTEKLDELDRDLLYMRSRNDTAAELQAKHPTIPAEILRLLQKESKRK